MGRHARLVALADLPAAAERSRRAPDGAHAPGVPATADRPLVVADLGCGSGRTVAAVLEVLDAAAAAGHPAGPRDGPRRVVVHAVDQVSALDEPLLADARVRSRIADLDAGLPLADASVDVAFSLNVLEHLVDPVAHLASVHRALVPGGVLVLAHSDWDTALFASGDDVLTRELVDLFVGAGGGGRERSDGFSGRKLLGHAAASGRRGAPWEVGEVAAWADAHRRFDDGSLGWKVATGVLAAAAGDADLAARASGWMEDLRSLAAAGQFLFAVTDVALVLRRAEGESTAPTDG